jgi:hypothetical protein
LSPWFATVARALALCAARAGWFRIRFALPNGTAVAERPL